MSGRTYRPDRWVVIKITNDEGKFHHRVFGSWFGGFADGNSWKMNSGIESVTENGDEYLFHGTSGSTYSCIKDTYGTHMYGEGVLQSYIEDAPKIGASIEVLPMDADYLNIVWSNNGD